MLYICKQQVENKSFRQNKEETDYTKVLVSAKAFLLY